MTVKTLPSDRVAVLRSLAKEGDLTARAIISLFDTDFMTMAQVVTPAAKGTSNVHAAVYGDVAGPVTVSSGFTNPDVPRNLRVVFGATWDGGSVTVSGVDVAGAGISEVFTGPGTVVGSKIFAGVSSLSYAGGGSGLHATNTITVGTGDKLGLPTRASQTLGMLYDSTPTALAPISIDTAVSGFTPANVPNGSLTYTVLFMV